MRKASLAAVLAVMSALCVAAALGGTTAAGAGSPPNTETIWVYRSSFTPSLMWDASGVMVTLVNQDTIAHRIVLYREATPTSVDVTLAPGQWYSLSEPLTCRAGCSSATYTFRDANRSKASGGSCYSFCAEVDVYYANGD